jgi:ATP-dependent metalloprotease
VLCQVPSSCSCLPCLASCLALPCGIVVIGRKGRHATFSAYFAPMSPLLTPFRFLSAYLRLLTSVNPQDFPKLRELHRARLTGASNGGTTRTLRILSQPLQSSTTLSSSPLFPNSKQMDVSPLAQQLQQRRYFWNRLERMRQDMDIRYWERQAVAAPDDIHVQFEYVRRLPPEGRLIYMRDPSVMVLSPSTAVLYLQTLLEIGQPNYLDLNDILRKLERGGALPPALGQEWKEAIHSQKLNKKDQVGQLLQYLTTGSSAGASMAAGTMAAAGSLATMGGSGSPMAASLAAAGRSSNQPLHVQVTPAPISPLRTAVMLLGRVAILFVGFAAVGALLDSQGIGRGMGMNQNSKHIQEAEKDGRKVRFEDVKGVDEAKAELEEIVLYLKDPTRFTRLGGKLPRGVLLTGPPGTGKTLLAKAIAGEADVPFFYASGSQFEEVYVGLGAKRIRELFEAAKKKKTAIIFIDEIDAVGGSRKLKDQSALKMTLNELLVQMDGFDANDGIIVVGATNFVESLDTALLRPGRFDKHVSVPLPDVGGRKAILEMYSEKTKLSPDVDLNVLARGTTGMSGADLFNLINQAAIKASVDGLNAINMAVMEYAKDKILMGAERRTAVITKETARTTAFHEAGHALVGVLTESAMPIHKATIMPRGLSLGMVSMLPEGDQTSQSKRQMLAMMDVAMGGRAAEELVFGHEAVTSGASSDILQATRIARAMVTKYGFSDTVGIVYHGGEVGEEASAETRALVDSEVKLLTQSAYDRAKSLLIKYTDRHRMLAETLLEYETLTGDEVRDIVKKGVKPKRAVINKKGGERGDTSVVGEDGRKKGSRGPSFLPGLGRNRSEESPSGR